MRVVFDTSVLVAAARSKDGASFALVSSIPSPLFQICLSVPLYLEWQEVLTRPEHLGGRRTAETMMGLLRYLCGHAQHSAVFFLLRPFLSDSGDDMILELAFAAGCRYIVTHNVRHFAGIEYFGIDAVTPSDFLTIVKKAGRST